jgi:phosphate starvation-inducible protein PhoH and related proteins
LIGGLEDVSHCAFSAADVVRHELVSRIVNAYDAADAAKQKPRKEP